MDKTAEDHRNQLDDEFELIELGSVSEETKGVIPDGAEGMSSLTSFA